MIFSLIQKIKDLFRGTLGGRSSEWRNVRNRFLNKNPFCAVCGGTKKCEVHHIESFHLHPEKELLETNLITLCENRKYGAVCHLLFGHLGNYKKENPNVREDAKIWREKLKR